MFQLYVAEPLLLELLNEVPQVLLAKGLAPAELLEQFVGIFPPILP